MPIPNESPVAESADRIEAVDGYVALDAPIGKAAVEEAAKVLLRYKQGKANLDRRVTEDEEWYKMRHWACLRHDKRDPVQPTSGFLFNALQNKHADAMDNFPAPNILPREEADRAEAKMLSSVVPVILDYAGFEQVYSDVWHYKLKTGTGIYGVFWDKTRANGLGDVAIRKIDIHELFWEPGVTDIQASRNLFHVELRDNDLLTDEYPQLAGKLGTATVKTAEYTYDETIDTSDKSAVIDWYYKKRGQDGRTLLHYCKFVNDEVLFATENDPELRLTGWYDHGKYPFVFDVLFPVEGMPTGFGYVDVAKDAQEYIDRGNQAVLKNMLANVKPRHFIRNDGAVNEEEYADQDKDFVHVDGALGQDSILPIQGKPLESIYVEVLNNKIEELKEVTGNRDISTGGTSGGVTASSAIAALQEAGSKLSRDNIKASYRAFRQTVDLVIELVRQFYDLPRKFRILGERGAEEYVMFSNAGLVAQLDANGLWRMPVFDIEVTAQKASPYSKMAQNELALQFYQMGFFNPAMADQALLCLDMMDFDGKDALVQKIIQQGMAYQAMMAAMPTAGAWAAPTKSASSDGLSGGGRVDDVSAGNTSGGEPKVTRDARRRVAESTSPN